MTAFSRLAVFVFLATLVSATVSQWDVRAATPQSGRPATSENPVNRVRKLLGRPPRGMPGNQVGKNHDLVRRAFRDCVKDANASTVSITSGGQQVALGTIVRQDGLILTKASELGKNLRCRIPGAGFVKAKKVAVDKSLDLALLKVEKRGLKPVAIPAVGSRQSENLLIGSWVATPGGFSDAPLVIGVVSGERRRIERDSPVIGVSIESSVAGVIVRQVVPGSGAESVGVQEGDVVKAINNVIVNTPDDLMRVVGRSEPGAKVRLKVQRDGRSLNFAPKLGRKTNLGMAEQGLLAHEGGPLSQRRSNFPTAIQHDCLIEPHQCGGPLVDVSGKVVGINIARAGRAVSYSLPLATITPALAEMVSESVAVR